MKTCSQVVIVFLAMLCSQIAVGGRPGHNDLFKKGGVCIVDPRIMKILEKRFDVLRNKDDVIGLLGKPDMITEIAKKKKRITYLWGLPRFTRKSLGPQEKRAILTGVGFIIDSKSKKVLFWSWNWEIISRIESGSRKNSD